MPVPTQTVQLSVEQVQELNQKLSTMRHDINNHLSLVLAATELIRHKPQMAERMMATLCEQPAKISDSIAKFSTEFENTLRLKQP
jgi:hypothetical protein